MRPQTRRAEDAAQASLDDYADPCCGEGRCCTYCIGDMLDYDLDDFAECPPSMPLTVPLVELL